MATRTGNEKSPQRRRKSLNKFFYLNGELHKILRLLRPSDYVEAWNYSQHRTFGYVWSDVQKRMERAFSLSQVCAMVGRHRVQLEKYMLSGQVRTPQRIYPLGSPDKPGKHFFSESDVLELHDFFLTVHRGRPRKDGKITPGKMPTRAELRAIMKHDLITYVQVGDEFKPLWKEPEW